MPLPTPNTGESRSEFMARFVLPIWKDGEKVWAPPGAWVTIHSFCGAVLGPEGDTRVRCWFCACVVLPIWKDGEKVWAQ